MDLTLEDAIVLATNAHRGQVDKAGRPYILHPLRVMLGVESLYERMAAVLHDVVEDTRVTLPDLIDFGYPREVTDAVDHLTRRTDETYAAFIDRCAVNPLALRVKIADVRDNLSPGRLALLSLKDSLRLSKRYERALTRLLRG